MTLRSSKLCAAKAFFVHQPHRDIDQKMANATTYIHQNKDGDRQVIQRNGCCRLPTTMVSGSREPGPFTVCKIKASFFVLRSILLSDSDF